LHATGHPIADRLGDAVAATDLEHRTTALSAGLLRAAARGHCIDPLAAFLRALSAEDVAPTSGAARRETAKLELLSVGHSSGRGLAEGALATLGLRESGLAA
jgi:hypothetical protein